MSKAKTGARPSQDAPPPAPPDTINAAQDYDVESYGSLTGIVTDETGQPIVGASLRAHYPYLEGEPVPGGATAIDGCYLMLRLPVGNCEIECEAAGYQNVGAHLRVHAGTRHSASFTMEPAPVQTPPADTWRPTPEYAAAARGIRLRWGVPPSALHALLAVRGRKNVRPGCNPFGIKATGTEPRDADGYATFPSISVAFVRMGQILATREPFVAATSRYRRGGDYTEYIKAIAVDESEASELLTFIAANSLTAFDKETTP